MVAIHPGTCALTWARFAERKGVAVGPHVLISPLAINTANSASYLRVVSMINHHGSDELVVDVYIPIHASTCWRSVNIGSHASE